MAVSAGYSIHYKKSITWSGHCKPYSIKLNGRKMVNPYTATVFCPENVVCCLCLLHIFKCTSEFFMDANNILSSLIWVHIVCNIGYLRK